MATKLIPSLRQKARKQKWLPILLEFISKLRIQSKESESIDDERGGSELDLWLSQQIFIEALCDGLEEGIHEFYYLKSRQLGCTTIGLAIVLFWLAVHPRIIGCLVADNDQNSAGFRVLLKQIMKSFPEDFAGDSFKIDGDNKFFMSFSNGSRLDLLVAGKHKKSWSDSKGYVFAWVSEIGAYGTQEGIDSFRESCAQNHPDRLFIYESRAYGYDTPWHDMWLSAQDDPYTKKTCFIGWWAKPFNSIDRDDRRFELFGTIPPNGEESEKIAKVAELYGYAVTMEQLAWYRWRQSDRSTAEGSLEQQQPWCVVAGTRIGTTRGILPIEEVRVGDLTTLGIASHAGATGLAPIFKVTTSLGYELEGTGNHPLIGLDGEETPISESIGRKVRLQPPRFAENIYSFEWNEPPTRCSIEITPDLARLIGAFMGDGSIHGSARSGWVVQIVCCKRDPDLAEEYVRLFREVFGITATIAEKKNHQNGKSGGWVAVIASSRHVFETFRKLGLTRQAPSTRRRVHVPEFIWRSPKHIVKEFLSGLFEADGFNGYERPRVSFTSKYPDFARDIQLLLLAFGITCRRRNVLVTHPNGHVFSQNSLSLRIQEAVKFNEEIGFLSERKRENWKCVQSHPIRPQSFDITLSDEVVGVEEEDREDIVYNVTVPGPHHFDASGFLTHNTELEAFQVQGYSFFQNRVLQKWCDEIDERQRLAHQEPDHPDAIKFRGYAFVLGTSIFQTEMREITDSAQIDQVTLRVWHEPHPDGLYVIGFDPAYGRTEWADRSAISVWRAYCDRLVQCAEFADDDLETHQASWILAYLSGAYRNCVVNIELAGPGRAVMREFDQLRERLHSDLYATQVRAREWDDFLDQARWYLYHRPDSPGPGYQYNFETTWRTKMELMNQFRDSFTTRILDIRSLPLLNEMGTMRQTRSDIAPEAPGRQKDDRVFAAALANRAWLDHLRSRLMQEGATYENISKTESGEYSAMGNFMRRLVFNFWRTAEERAENPYEPTSWLSDRGFQ